ncbi:MAG: hypothetical protein KTR14_11165 [Vampirovibrio sp.]|nr:hypothetical protein [Vampirovibrio sp.]
MMKIVGASQLSFYPVHKNRNAQTITPFFNRFGSDVFVDSSLATVKNLSASSSIVSPGRTLLLDEQQQLILPDSIRRQRQKVLQAITKEVSQAVRQGKKPVFMTDFDGTLAPFQTNPYTCQVPKTEREKFFSFADAVHKKFGVPVVVITGRTVSRMKDFIGEEGIRRAQVIINGQSGGEMALPDRKQMYSMPDVTSVHKAQMDQLKQALKEIGLKTVEEVEGASKEPGPFPGVSVEDEKRYCVVVHTKSARTKNVAEAAERAVQKAMKKLNMKDFYLLNIEGGMEAIPKPYNKGNGVKAVLDIVRKKYGLTNSQLHPIYIGDGINDNKAYEQIAKIFNHPQDSYTTIFTGKPTRQTKAKYTIPNALHTGDVPAKSKAEEKYRVAVSQVNVDANFELMERLRQKIGVAWN